VLFKTLLSFAVTALMISPCCAQLTNTQGGALGGGTAGAIIGGIIGNQNDETSEGVLIGGAVGAIAGGLLGKQRDNIEIENYQIQQYRAQQARQYAQRQAEQQAIQFANGVSIGDVIALSQSGVSSNVVINQIQTNGVQQRIGVNEIISLHQNGVDSNVISVMQQARLAGSTKVIPASPNAGYSTETTVYSRPRPVVVSPRPTIEISPGCGRARPPHHRGAGHYQRYASPRGSYYR